MKITHEEYLKTVLKSGKIELDQLIAINRIAIAEHEVKKRLYIEQIDSIEKQLSENGHLF